MALPTEKSAPSLNPDRLKALLYGPPKVGKSTFASKINPDHTLFIATEPGLGALEVYEEPVSTWTKFREVGADLANDAKGDKRFEIAVVDTVDELYRMCSDHVCAELGIKHPADADFGKGWAAVRDEFALRIGKLTSLGLGVWFVSHAEDREVKKKVGSKTVTQPSLTGQGRKFLTGFVDFIFLATWEGEEGDERVLRTQGGEHHEAGGRMLEGAKPLPDPLPLDVGALRKAMAASLAPEKEQPSKTSAKKEEKS